MYKHQSITLFVNGIDRSPKDNLSLLIHKCINNIIVVINGNNLICNASVAVTVPTRC